MMQFYDEVKNKFNGLNAIPIYILELDSLNFASHVFINIFI
ncbi:hypothetical protein VIBNISFn118_720033 [Vibrio nigripulchritudo SFn118]|nr:hypothetical protein VIBNISFn118_720033 [Vibrio nigripulchritudo SFn118]